MIKHKKISTTLHIYGVVQGVGFRPFVAKIAKECEILGNVLNNSGIVEITAVGTQEAMDKFIHRLKVFPPIGTIITNIVTKNVEYANFKDFSIIESNNNINSVPAIPADLPMCDKCTDELYDVKNRRFMHPFISCVSCGPRYSIINELPYDRCRTTMDCFDMCDDCKREYNGTERRAYAQTISCNKCGPKLIFKDEFNYLEENLAFNKVVDIIRSGGIVAVKGVGGYNYICSPFIENAVNNLRLLKGREKKPFAVMFNNVLDIEKYCFLNENEIDLITSAPRPIVLLLRKNNDICEQVYKNSRFLGAFISYTPLYRMFIDKLGPLIVTSANITNEPIIIDDNKMLNIKSPFLNGVLYNKRKIVVPIDDSVARVVLGKSQLIRRGRGYVPTHIELNSKKELPTIVATGADLKANFCLLKDNKAILSQYIGDLESIYVYNSFEENYKHMTKLLNIKPKYVVCDMHPNYLSTKFAINTNLPILKVLHHHAHVASVMAEHSIDDEIIGIAFDGTGYGDDGAIWGGEFLLCSDSDYKRVAHVDYTTMCGGDNSSKDAMKTLLCYLSNIGLDFEHKDFELIKSAINNKINTHISSSMGRLFDAVSALLLGGGYNSYEGECAINLENLASSAHEVYDLKFDIENIEGVYILKYDKLFKDIIYALQNNIDKSKIALGFHYAIANVCVEICNIIRKCYNVNKVALCGGVFSNIILLEKLNDLLKQNGFEIYINEKVPCNDGSIALGQAYVCQKYLEG